MYRMLSILAIIACLAATPTSAQTSEAWLETFEDPIVYPPGTPLADTAPWWAPPGSKGPTILSDVGVAGSVGLSPSQRNFHWLARPFEWKDPTIGGVVVQFDLRTPGQADPYFPWRNDELGWTTNPESESSSDFFQVTMARVTSPTYVGQIKGKWRNASSGTSGGQRDPVIVEYPRELLNEFAYYRLRAEFTKLTSTSARIDVSLAAINSDGSIGDVIASGSILDTDELPEIQRPHPDHFSPAVMWPTYKSYNENAAGPADNTYFEIIRSVPACASKVTPDEFTTQAVEADVNQPATPSSIPYLIENLGSEGLTYTVSELDDQQQPADVSWLSTDKTGGSAAAESFDTVIASIDTTGLGHGMYTAYLKFTDSCDPAVEHLRRIDLTVYSCHWTAECSQERSYSTVYPDLLPEDVVYRITNVGDAPSSYSVVKTGGSSCMNYNWLVVNNPAGTVLPGEFIDVVATIDVQALAGRPSNSSYDCTLKFYDDCSPLPVTRNVRMRYLAEPHTQVFVYKGDVDPQDNDSAGPMMRFVPDPDSLANGLVENNFDAVNGKVWRMIDPSGSIKAWYRAQYFDGFEWQNMTHNAEGGSTLVARIKVDGWSADRRRAFLGIGENDASSAEYHWGGADGVAAESKRNLEWHTGLGTSDFVILWVTAKGAQAGDEWECGREVNLYIVDVDSNVLWHRQIANASAEGSSRTGFFFGDSQGALSMDVSYDWVSGTNAGAFAPGEEVAVLGHSLIVSDSGCIIPFPDTDQDDDVDMDDFAIFQRCINVNGNVSEDCECLDRNRDGYVDEIDMEAFIACVTGSGVPFDPRNPPVNCQP
jgi:hypothetical protein